jgi:hypothetical protein
MRHAWFGDRVVFLRPNEPILIFIGDSTMVADASVAINGERIALIGEPEKKGVVVL